MVMLAPDDQLDLPRRRAPLGTMAGAGPMIAPTVPTTPKPPTPSFTPMPQSLGGAQQPQVSPGTKPAAGPAPMILPPISPGGAGGPAVEPTAPGAPQPLSDFGPGNDLRYTQINPMDDARTTNFSRMADVAAGKIGSGPDLAQAGLNKLAELRQATSEDRRVGMQNIGRGAAMFGRLGGSGVTTGQLGDLEATLQARELAAQKGLAGDLATQESADQRANASTLSALQDQVFGQGAQRRNELRGERGYEYGASNDAYNRDVQKRLLQEDLTNSQFGRNVTAAQLGLEGAGQYDATAQDAMGSAADLAGSLAMYNARGLTPGASPAAAPTPQAPTGYRWVGGRLVPDQPTSY